MDDTGVPQKDAIHDIYKHRLTSTGEKEGFPEKQELGNTVRTEAELEELVKQQKEAEKQPGFIKTAIGDCGNCYGAGTGCRAGVSACWLEIQASWDCPGLILFTIYAA